MTLLVTGAAGFIGSNFVRYYLNEYKNRKIIGLDKLTYAGNLDNFSSLEKKHKERFIFLKGDINNRDLLKDIFSKYEISYVINFAAESHVDRSIIDSREFLNTNILGTHNLLDISKEFWIKNGKVMKSTRFIQISTDEVYGSLGKTGYFTEKTPVNPQSPYSASKAAADFLTYSYYNTYNLPINITRCSNNYGPFQFPEKLIPLMIYNALSHNSLPVYGDGNHIRDWIFVDDHCRAIDMILENGTEGEIYNIGGYNERKNIDIVKMIIKILRRKTHDNKINSSLIKFVKDRPGHDRRYAIDPYKIKKELGWETKVSFNEGIQRAIDWYLKNTAWMKKIITGEYLRFYDENYSDRSI